MISAVSSNFIYVLQFESFDNLRNPKVKATIGISSMLLSCQFLNVQWSDNVLRDVSTKPRKIDYNTPCNQLF